MVTAQNPDGAELIVHWVESQIETAGYSQSTSQRIGNFAVRIYENREVGHCNMLKTCFSSIRKIQVWEPKCKFH